MISLDPTEEVTARPFSSVAHGEHDLAVMNRMLDRLRHHVDGVDHTRGPRDDRFVDRGEHMIVLPNPHLLGHPSSTTADLAAVGFFGQARVDVDHRPILDLEEELVRLMPGTPGLVAYYNVHWPTEGWGNLVLFTDDVSKGGWGHRELHHDAVERSAAHYHSIRLHNGVVTDGLSGRAPIRWVRIKYLDFATDPPWRAVRTIAHST